MKIAIIAQYNPVMFPALQQIAHSLSNEGGEVQFLSTYEPVNVVDSERVVWTSIPRSDGVRKHLPFFRAQGDFIFRRLQEVRPAWIIAQHEYLLPTLAYRATIGREAKVAAYFADYHGDRRYVHVVGRLARFLDAYVDVCDVRLGWRKADWPLMAAEAFTIRQAPFRREVASLDSHQGSLRVAFTGSKYVLGLDRIRLARFMNRLCERGVNIDWYLPGESEVRELARSLTSNPRFRVRDPVDKSHLLDTLGKYDAGLHWAPLAEKAHDPDYFLSAASNKIGEYIAAGLVVLHSGNPGLSYLPDEVCVTYDATNPETGADQLADLLGDRATIERKRRAALRYHLDEMNFEDQARPFVHWVLGKRNSPR